MNSDEPECEKANQELAKWKILRGFLSKLPQNPILTSVILSSIALVIATVLIDVPRSLLQPGPSDALHYFLIGATFNVARFLLLGLAIGYLYTKLGGSSSLQSTTARLS